MDNVEGYIKWIHELSPSIRRGQTLEVYLNGFLESKKRHCQAMGYSPIKNGNGSHHGGAGAENDHASLKFGGSSSWKDATNDLTRMLSSAAIYIITGKKGSAKYLLTELDKLVDRFTDSSDPQCKVIIHCKDVLWWQLYGNKQDGEMLKFNAKWTDLVGQSYEGEATVYFLKGMLGVKLRIDEDKVKEFFWIATLLDPKCLMWYHLAYRCFRRIRGKGGAQGEPSSQEKELAETSYKLSGGQHVLVAADYALMLKDIMWSKKHDQRLWDQYHRTFMECVLVYETALVLAKGTSLYTSIKLNFAELMHFGRGSSVTKMRGKQLFAELEKESTEDAFVLHKLGNVYRDEGKLDLARDLYQRALKLGPTVVTCILDYQKLLAKMGDYKEILSVVNKALSPEFVRSHKDTAKLEMERDLAMIELRKGRNSAADLDDNWRRRK